MKHTRIRWLQTYLLIESGQSELAQRLILVDNKFIIQAFYKYPPGQIRVFLLQFVGLSNAFIPKQVFQKKGGRF